MLLRYGGVKAKAHRPLNYMVQDMQNSRRLRTNDAVSGMVGWVAFA